MLSYMLSFDTNLVVDVVYYEIGATKIVPELVF
jgi:hypothetical protein